MTVSNTENKTPIEEPVEIFFRQSLDFRESSTFYIFQERRGETDREEQRMTDKGETEKQSYFSGY